MFKVSRCAETKHLKLETCNLEPLAETLHEIGCLVGFATNQCGLFHPDDGETQHVSGLMLLPVAGNKGNRQPRLRLEYNRRCQMYRIERTHICLLNQFFGLQEDRFPCLHKFPIIPIFAQP